METDLVLPNVEGLHPESIEPLISANRPVEPSGQPPVGSQSPLERWI